MESPGYISSGSVTAFIVFARLHVFDTGSSEAYTGLISPLNYYNKYDYTTWLNVTQLDAKRNTRVIDKLRNQLGPISGKASF